MIGKRFWTGALASLAGIDRAELEAAPARPRAARSSSAASASSSVAEEQRVRVPPPARPGRRLRPDPARRARGRSTSLAARWIERLGRREDHAEMLAHHYLQALELTAAAGGARRGASQRAARTALTDAGDRAFAPARIRRRRSFLPGCCSSSSARTTPERPPAPPPRYRRFGYVGSPTTSVLERGRDELLAAGDVEGAVEAETALAEQYWMTGDRDAALEHSIAHSALVEPLPRLPGEGACDRRWPRGS